MRKILVIGLISSSLLLWGCFKSELVPEEKKKVQENVQTWIVDTLSAKINQPIEMNSWTTEITQTWIISVELNKSNSWIVINNINLDNKYWDIINYIESYNGIINEYTLWNNDLIRISSINFNSFKNKALYIIWDRFEWEKYYNKDELWEYSSTERVVSAIILYDKNLNSNKVLFIWEWWWNWWFSRYIYPKFTYKDGLILHNSNYNSTVFINDISSYTWSILEIKNLEQFSYYDNLKIKWIFTQYILYNSNLSIEEEFWWWFFINFPKIFWYFIANHLDKKTITFSYSYYKLKDDFNRLKNTKYFLNNKKDITLWRTDKDKYDHDYAENISKSENFDLSVLYTDKLSAIDDLMNESWHEKIVKNKENKVILSIKKIDPKLINFSFEKHINIWNVDFHVFKINFKNKKFYFVYDLKNQKWTFINDKKDLLGFNKKGNLIFSDWILDLWKLDFKEYVEINWL